MRVLKKKKRMVVSFSGGRTSAFMSQWLLANKSDEYEFLFVFANTGFEHPDTLRFANAVDKYFGLNLVWLESVVHRGEKKSCTHKVVSYRKASRHGEPFEAMCSKYGVPNHTFKFCTRELKLYPIKSYVKTIWEPGSYVTAVGIRNDETRRVSKNAEEGGIVYPLVHMIPTDKEDVLEFFKQFKWDLKILEHQGNCVTCFKKSLKKLSILHKEDPHNFDFFLHLDKQYGSVGPNNVPGPRKMFRGWRDTAQLIQWFKEVPVAKISTVDGGCSESCELYETE